MSNISPDSVSALDAQNLNEKYYPSLILWLHNNIFKTEKIMSKGQFPFSQNKANNWRRTIETKRKLQILQLQWIETNSLEEAII